MIQTILASPIDEVPGGAKTDVGPEWEVEKSRTVQLPGRESKRGRGKLAGVGNEESPCHSPCQNPCFPNGWPQFYRMVGKRKEKKERRADGKGQVQNTRPLQL